ncbi:MAG TPA: hypothetical protein VNA16_08565 [Abditibacteriaceae bacterium]|nr:hypothetical protein [Abditibacteriaceae bacterium]
MIDVQPQRESLRAGVAQVDITPAPGVPLAGAVGALRLTEEILDPLYAKAIVFEAGGRKLCIVALDLTIITKEYTVAIRRAAVAKLGFDTDAVMVHATQTHSAPCVGHIMLDKDFEGVPDELEWINGSDAAYNKFAVERSIAAIEQAHSNLQPARIGVGSGIEGRMAFNRRAVMRDGKVFMPHSPWANNPLGPTQLLYMEGPIDPEVGVLGVRSGAGDLMAVLVNYTCHPVHVFPKPIVSADWPGALADELRQTYGEGCTPIVLNGACGNINPWPPFEPDYEYNGDHRRMGAVLADMARKVTETLEFAEKAVLDWRVKHVGLPFREVDAEQVEADRALLAEYSSPPWTDETRTSIRMDWMLAASRMSAHLQRQREGAFDYEIQVFRIGDTAFVSLPGEPFVEGQLRIKAASPVRHTYIVHCTTQYVGYIPTREAMPAGGHEANFSHWSKLAPEALDLVVEGALELLRESFED